MMFLKAYFKLTGPHIKYTGVLVNWWRGFFASKNFSLKRELTISRESVATGKNVTPGRFIWVSIDMTWEWSFQFVLFSIKQESVGNRCLGCIKNFHSYSINWSPFRNTSKHIYLSLGSSWWVYDIILSICQPYIISLFENLMNGLD